MPGVEQIETPLVKTTVFPERRSSATSSTARDPRQHAALTGAIDSHDPEGPIALSGPVNVIAAENCHECFGR